MREMEKTASLFSLEVVTPVHARHKVSYAVEQQQHSSDSSHHRKAQTPRNADSHSRVATIAGGAASFSSG